MGGRKKGHKTGELEDDPLNKPRSHHLQRKIDARKPGAKLDQHLEDQFTSGRLLACISSRPGQSGRCDGYILEGKELDFYLKKLERKKEVSPLSPSSAASILSADSMIDMKATVLV